MPLHGSGRGLTMVPQGIFHPHPRRAHCIYGVFQFWWINGDLWYAIVKELRKLPWLGKLILIDSP